MLGSALAHIAEGLTRPRASIERLLARDPTVADAALMVVLSYSVQAIVTLLVPGARGAVGAIGLANHLLWLLLSIAGTFVLGFLIFVIGRAFGGTASREQSLVVAAWHTLVMTLLVPLYLFGALQVGEEQIPPGAVMVMLIYGAIWFWLLARYTAVAHKFANEWNVVGVMVGVAILFSAFLMMVQGA